MVNDSWTYTTVSYPFLISAQSANLNGPPVFDTATKDPFQTKPTATAPSDDSIILIKTLSKQTNKVRFPCSTPSFYAWIALGGHHLSYCIQVLDTETALDNPPSDFEETAKAEHSPNLTDTNQAAPDSQADVTFHLINVSYSLSLHLFLPAVSYHPFTFIIFLTGIHWICHRQHIN